MFMLFIWCLWGRGQKVMMDSDLAEIYGHTTKAFKQQLNRNIVKFDEDFMFRLSWEDLDIFVRSQNATLKNKQGSNTNTI